MTALALQLFSLFTWPYRTARWAAGLVFPCSLYLIWIPGDWYIFYKRVKIGISENVPARLAEIRRKTGLDARVLFWFPLPFAKMFEQGFLYATRHWRQEMPYHSGHTEWRRCYNFVGVIFTAIFMFRWGYDLKEIFNVCLGVIIMPLPVDYGLLWVIVVAMSYAFLAGLIWLGVFIIQTVPI